VKLLSALGVVAAIVIAALGRTIEVKPYGLLTGWLAVGLVYYSFTRTRRARTQPAAEGA
jgi:APA family basic amino acid/polyamine antiporter